MIKEGLKSQSQSNGRELEHTILALQNEQVEEEFQSLINKVTENRKMRPKGRNGLKKFNTLFETYIKKIHKEYKTVNVFARHLNSDNFIPFWQKLTAFVKANSHIFKGRLEPHPADREINSWHIQYIGANAKQIEKILAAFIVKEKLENSMESALGRGVKPYYEEIEEIPSITKVSDELLMNKLIDIAKNPYIDEDLQQATEMIKSIKEDVLTDPKITSNDLKSRLENIKLRLGIAKDRPVFEDIKNRKSEQVKKIIEQLKQKKDNNKE